MTRMYDIYKDPFANHNKKAMLEQVRRHFEEYGLFWFGRLESRLKDGRRFIAGDQISVYDMNIGCALCNMLNNKHSKEHRYGMEVWSKAPQLVVRYYHDFCEEMKEYLEARP